MSWPQRPELWSGHYAEIQNTWARIAAALSCVEELHILLRDSSAKAGIQERIAKSPKVLKKQGQPSSPGTECEPIFFHSIPTNDVWVRDYAPLWVDSRTAIQYAFDGWAKKYSPWEEDCAAGEILLSQWGHRSINRNMALEGGAFDTDGDTLLVSESCLLYRRPYMSHEAWAKELCLYLGKKRLVWIKGPLPGDDTDGHVDMSARFVAPNTALCSRAKKNEAAYDILQENRRRLQSASRFCTALQDEDREVHLEMIDLPLPPQAYVQGRALARTYANFYIANGLLLMPVYGEKTDYEAVSILQNCFPKHHIEAVDVSSMILEGGALHCMTMQIPDFVEIGKEHGAK